MTSPPPRPRQHRHRTPRLAGLAAVASAIVLGGCGSTQTPAARSSPPEARAQRPWRPSDVVITREPWSFYGTPGETILTPSYRIFTTERSGLLVDRLPGFIELALAEYRTGLIADGTVTTPLPEPDGRMTTYLMDNRPQWEHITRVLTGDRAETYLRIDRGGYAFDGRGVYFDIGLRDTLNIAAHEGWHQYTQSAFRSRLPIALEEGIASYMEGYRWDPANPSLPVFRPWANPDRFDQLRHADRDGRLLPFSQLIDTRPQDLLETRGPGVFDYYAQVWAMVHFLREGADGRYAPRLTRLLREAASGALPRTVLGRAEGRDAHVALSSGRGGPVYAVYIDPDLDRLDREYAEFLAQLVRPGSRDAISAGESPFARRGADR